MQTHRFPSDPSDRMPIGPFLGHRAQLERLCRGVEEARLGHGSRVWIVGPTGIGKSRLLEEIARYAAWRRVRVDYATATPLENASDRREVRLEPSLLIVDPVASALLGEWNEELCRISKNSTLALATATSAESFSSAGIPEAAFISLNGLDPEDCLRLFEACLGSAFDSAWARRAAVSAGGQPGEMRRAAASFLERRRHGVRIQAPPSDG